MPSRSDPTEAQALLKRACTACLILLSSCIVEQHTQTCEGLAALQMEDTKDHNLCFGDADGEAIGEA